MEALNKVFVQRTFSCSASDLFNYWVQPALLAKWFGPKHLSVGRTQIDLQLGGKYTIELQRADGSSFFIEGRYLEIHPPKKLLFSYHYKGLSPTPPDSTVSILIQALSDNSCHLSLTQTFSAQSTDMAQRTLAWDHMMEVLGSLSAHPLP